MIVKLLTSALEYISNQSLKQAKNANNRAMKVFVIAKKNLDRSNAKLNAKRENVLGQLDRLDILQDNLSLSISKGQTQSKKIEEFING